MILKITKCASSTQIGLIMPTFLFEIKLANLLMVIADSSRLLVRLVILIGKLFTHAYIDSGQTNELVLNLEWKNWLNLHAFVDGDP